jgi:prolyl-tRNA synthetase
MMLSTKEYAEDSKIEDDEDIGRHLLRHRILALGPSKGTYIWLAPMVKWVKKLRTLHARYFKQFVEITTPATCDSASFTRMEEGLGNTAILNSVFFFEDKVLVPTSQSCLYGSTWLQNICKKRSALPLRFRMYSRVWRRERKVTPLIRNTEIMAFWECHSVHETYEESHNETIANALKYRTFFRQLGLNALLINRFKSDAFTGAQTTWALDLIIKKRRIQLATSHDIGDSYSRIFELCTRSKDNQMVHVWQSCHGMTERVIGAILHSSLYEVGRIVLPKVLRLKQLVTILPPTDQDYAFYDIIHPLQNIQGAAALIQQCLARDSILTIMTKEDRSEATIRDRQHRRKMFPEETYFYESPICTQMRGEKPVRVWSVPGSLLSREQYWEQRLGRELTQGQVLYGHGEGQVYGGPTY